jgi:hypothetical protein
MDEVQNKPEEVHYTPSSESFQVYLYMAVWDFKFCCADIIFPPPPHQYYQWGEFWNGKLLCISVTLPVTTLILVDEWRIFEVL